MLSFKTPPKNETDLMRAIARDVAWHVVYHEEELEIANRVLTCVKAFLERGSYSFSIEEAQAEYDDDPDREDFDDPIEWIKHVVGSRASAVEYHQQELMKAHSLFGALKGILSRGDYAEIDLETIVKTTRAKDKES